LESEVVENSTTPPGRAPGSPIKVAIIEDQRDIRECLTFLINGTEGFSCTGSYRSMEEALDRIRSPLPDIVLADIGLPGMNGIEGVRILKERHPDLLILMSTVYDDDDRVFDAICAGACGYLLKKTPPARLLEGIREAVSGGAPMTPEVARRVFKLFREIRPPERANYELTPHEVRLLKLFVEGHNYKTAASELGVSVNTINFHVRNIYDKLQVHSRSEAVAKALLNRLV
jgi:DNA-binding NarL/FixJ family response regulator